MSSPEPDYLEPYAQAAREHGPGFRATLWSNPDTQRLRFRIMTELVELSGRVVLDAGAGPGDLAAYLRERRIGYERYIGLEGIEAQAEAARERALPRSRFVVRDFVGDEGVFAELSEEAAGVDVVVFSGSLNTLDGPAAEATLDRAWGIAREAVVFNFLSTRQGAGALPLKPGDPARRLDPIRLLDWAMERTPTVVLRQDYFRGHDATIAMIRPV